MVVADMEFVQDGVYTVKTSSTSTIGIHYPAYARHYRVLMVEREGLKTQYTYAYTVIPPEKLSPSLTNSTLLIEMEIRRKYQAPADDAWMDTQLNLFLDDLERAGWDNRTYTETRQP